MKKNKLLIAISVVVLACVFAIVTRIGRQPAESDDVIRIGAILPSSGATAALGVPKQRAFDMVMMEWNAQNPSTKIQMFYEDSKGNPKDGVAAFQKMVSNGSIPYCYVDLTTIVNSVIPLVDRNKIISFAGSAEPGVSSASQYLFRLFAGGDQEIDLMMEHLKKNDVKSIFVLHTNELYGNNSYTFLEKKYIEMGGRVLGHEAYPMNNVDFKDSLAKAKGACADRILLLGYGNEYSPLLRQAKEMGIAPSQILCNLGGSNKSVIDLPKEYKEGMYFVGPRFSFAMMNGNMSNETRHFVDSYKQRYGELPDFRAAYAYDAIKILVKAVDSVAGRNVDTIRSKILEIKEYQGASGTVSFLPNGEALTDLVIAHYSEGIMAL